MSWWVIPVSLSAVETRIRAGRRLAFEVLTAFGAKQPNGAATRILRVEDDRKLVEFKTPVRGRIVTTQEWVRAVAPEEIRFSAIKGPLQLLEDRFLLQDDNGCTRFRYESTVGVRGWLLGWLIARYYAKPRMERFMQEHTVEMKASIEERASRSKVFAPPLCD